MKNSHNAIKQLSILHILMPDLNPCLDTKKNPHFPIYLLLHALAEVCTLWVLLLYYYQWSSSVS